MPCCTYAGVRLFRAKFKVEFRQAPLRQTYKYPEVESLCVLKIVRSCEPCGNNRTIRSIVSDPPMTRRGEIKLGKRVRSWNKKQIERR